MSVVDISPSTSAHRLRFRGVLFRVAAVLLGLLPLAAFEMACRFAGWGRPERYDDPFVGFSAVRPLFVPSADGSRRETAANRLSHFQPDGFAQPKSAGEFRAFVLGGSTVQGRPYSIETSFTAWLEVTLRTAEPARSWRVVNCGGVSYATYRLAPILDEVLNYEPDLIVFYEGHNEFLEDRTYAEIKHAPAWFAHTHEQASRLRTYNLLRAALRGRTTADDSTQPATTKPSAMLPVEADARLDWQGGLNAYHYDPAWRADCIRHFTFNLRRIVDTCRSRGVPLLLLNPASNLDWAPFKAEGRGDLTIAQQQDVARLRDEARSAYAADLRHAEKCLTQATAIDDRDAGLWYDLGKCRMELRDFAGAHEALLRAKDEDVCPLRILQPMNAAVLQTAAATATPLVDADALFASLSPGGINGSKWFVDHVHPTVAGHQRLAEALFNAMVREGFVLQPTDEAWPTRLRHAFDEHERSLPAAYFPDGAKRLQSEQGWARGQATRVRPP